MPLHELFAQLLHDLIVKVTATQVSVRLMSDDASFLLLEASDSDGCLGVAHVDESDNSLISFVEVSLTEETIVVDDCCALIDNAKGFEASDLRGVDKSLTLCVGCVRGDSKDHILGSNLIPHVELVEFA